MNTISDLHKAKRRTEMSKKELPRVGDTVWVRAEVTEIEGSGHMLPIRIYDWVSASDWRPDAPAEVERKPWEVLREAAEIIQKRSTGGTPALLRQHATMMEREATTPPDPVEVLREYDRVQSEAWPGGPEEMPSHHPGLSIWRDARRVLAAHDAKKERK
jgi:hypothetical protein